MAVQGVGTVRPVPWNIISPGCVADDLNGVKGSRTWATYRLPQRTGRNVQGHFAAFEPRFGQELDRIAEFVGEAEVHG